MMKKQLMVKLKRMVKFQQLILMLFPSRIMLNQSKFLLSRALMRELHLHQKIMMLNLSSSSGRGIAAR